MEDLSQELGMLELVAKSLTQDDPMDSIQVGKAVFVKESYTTLFLKMVPQSACLNECIVALVAFV